MPTDDKVLVKGYNPDPYKEYIVVDVFGDGERAPIYPDGAIIKSLRSGQNCFQVLAYLGEGRHAVRVVGKYLGLKKPPEELQPDMIYGLADNKCRLVVHGEEVLFTEMFDLFKGISDDLLDALPEKDVAEFSGSEEFTAYSEVMENGVTLPYDKRKKFVKMVDDLLGKLPEKKIEEFVDSDSYVVYEETARHYRVGDD